MRRPIRERCRTPRRPPRALALTALIAALTAAGCLPAPATAEGRAIGELYLGFVVIAAGIAAVVFGLTTWAIVRHRARGRTDLPVQTRGNVRLEIVWTAIPVVIVVGLFVATLGVLARLEPRATAPDTELRVEAFRWGWSFSYPADGITVTGIGTDGPEAVVPVGRPIRLTLAAHDVIHSFYVPVFLFKRDAVPGRESVFEFTVEEPGTYRGQCAEFCGVFHSRMPFSIRAVPEAEFAAWLADQPRDPSP
ncbi:MAG TPA: cytochrome c oxidase subunit II [Candidatus Limnocylindrales bacterium]|nr:cytochrome c oxidase subunit II [Candidatus Limnocylindrales bacterium]